MTLYRFKVRNGAAAEHDGAVRVWIDPADTRDLESEFELTLTRADASWEGCFLLPSGAEGGFSYRVGLLGEVGTWWSLSIRDVSRRCDLVSDADCLTEPKAWIMGSLCAPPRGAGVAQKQWDTNRRGL